MLINICKDLLSIKKKPIDYTGFSNDESHF